MKYKYSRAVKAGLALLTSIGLLSGCARSEEKAGEIGEKMQEEKKEKDMSPADKMAQSKNVIEDAQDMLAYSLFADPTEDGTYDTYINRGEERIQWTNDIQASMLYLKSGDTIETGKDSMLVFSVGQSLMESGVEGESVITLNEYEDGEKFEVEGKLKSGAITYALRELGQISQVRIETDNTQVTSGDGSMVRVSYRAGTVRISVLRGSAKAQFAGKVKTVEAGQELTIDETQEEIPETTELNMDGFSLEAIIEASSLSMYTLSVDETIQNKISEAIQKASEELAQSQ